VSEEPIVKVEVEEGYGQNDQQPSELSAGHSGRLTDGPLPESGSNEVGLDVPGETPIDAIKIEPVKIEPSEIFLKTEPLQETFHGHYGDSQVQSADTTFSYLNSVTRCQVDKCGILFPSQILLNEHLKTHFRCTFCDERFLSAEMVEKHVIADHPKRTINKCPHCCIIFPNEPQLKAHLKKHLVCKEEGCLLAFDTKELLSEHLSSFHASVECCGKLFRSRLLLADHQKNVHTVHKCNFDGCSRIFPKLSQLTAHVRFNHTTYTCTYDGCNKTFQKSQKLKDHMAVHTRLFSLSCPYPRCKESFLSQSNLEKHLATHLAGYRKETPILVKTKRVRPQNVPVKIASKAMAPKKVAILDYISFYKAEMKKTKLSKNILSSVEERAMYEPNGNIEEENVEVTNKSPCSNSETLSDKKAQAHMPQSSDATNECSQSKTFDKASKLIPPIIGTENRKMKTYTCRIDNCGKIFGDRGALSRHKEIHAFRCNFEGCGRTLMSKLQLYRHTIKCLYNPLYASNSAIKHSDINRSIGAENKGNLLNDAELELDEGTKTTYSAIELNSDTDNNTCEKESVKNIENDLRLDIKTEAESMDFS